MAQKLYDVRLKIVIIGDINVGKSCLMYRFADNVFTSGYITNVGVDFLSRTIEVNKKKVKLELWDTAGHERFRTITSSFYKGAHGIIIVYDVTNIKSFNSVTKWIENIREHTNNPNIILIGNKLDAENRVVSFDQGNSFAINNNIKFYETSAKNGDNVYDAFTSFTENIIESVGDDNCDKLIVQLNQPIKKGCCY
jgi:small GTP-binding protein